MSLLEDVFLQEEANEVDNLERVIEGDEFQERRSSDSDGNSEKEDEASEDKRRVDPEKKTATRVVRNPRFLLNATLLTGPRGIQVIPDHFKDFNFKGKGYENEDLDLVLKKLEHWAYRLYPKYQFGDCLKKIESLGKKRPVAVHLKKIRSDQLLSDDIVVQKDSNDIEIPLVEEEDEFDKLLQQRIELVTPARNSVKAPIYDGSTNDNGTTSLEIPKVTSLSSINDEQRERMLRSRKLAEERRLARLRNVQAEHNVENSEKDLEQRTESNGHIEKDITSKNRNRANIIDSSDEETVDESSLSVAVVVHATGLITDEIGSQQNECGTRNNSDDNSNDEDMKEIESKKENSNTIISSNSQITETDKYIAIDNHDKEKANYDDSEINTAHDEGKQRNENLKLIDNMHEESAENEKLRYDDSDINIDSNEHDLHQENNEHKINSEMASEMEETNNVLNYAENTAKVFDTDISATKASMALNLNEKPCISTENDDIINENIIEAKLVSEELKDIMDVDFDDDF